MHDPGTDLRKNGERVDLAAVLRSAPKAVDA